MNEILSIRHLARDCTWDAWSEWTQCSKSCDNGIRERTREKLVVEVGGGTCSGQPRESESCKLEFCLGKVLYEFLKLLCAILSYEIFLNDVKHPHLI